MHGILVLVWISGWMVVLRSARHPFRRTPGADRDVAGRGRTHRDRPVSPELRPGPVVGAGGRDPLRVGHRLLLPDDGGAGERAVAPHGIARDRADGRRRPRHGGRRRRAADRQPGRPVPGQGARPRRGRRQSSSGWTSASRIIWRRRRAGRARWTRATSAMPWAPRARRSRHCGRRGRCRATRRPRRCARWWPRGSTIRWWLRPTRSCSQPRRAAGRTSFRYVAPAALILVAVFGTMYVNDRRRGGYRAERLERVRPETSAASSATP